MLHQLERLFSEFKARQEEPKGLPLVGTVGRLVKEQRIMITWSLSNKLDSQVSLMHSSPHSMTIMVSPENVTPDTKVMGLGKDQ